MTQFTKEETDGITRILCVAHLDIEAAKQFTELSKQWVLSPNATILLDAKQAEDLTPDFYTAVIQLRTALKKEMKLLFTIGLSEKLLKQIDNDGMKTIFEPVTSLADVAAKQKPATPASALNSTFIKPFLLGVLKTLEVQCRTPTKPLKPFVKAGAIPEIAIASIINLMSSTYTGSVVLCFPEKVFLSIYQNMFDEKLDKITDEAQDAAGELLNIIYGTAKTGLNEQGYDFQKALPTILMADGLRVRQTGNQHVIVMPFVTAAGQFHMEFEIKKIST